MTILELTGTAHGFAAQLNGVKTREKALKLQKARIKAQQVQQQLRAAQAPTKP